MAQRMLEVAIVSLMLTAGACSHPQKPAPAKVASTTAKGPAIAKAPAPQAAPAKANSTEGLTRAAAIYFDFDSALVREDSRPVLQAIGATAKATNGTVRIEGHTDERGTTEYNLALGDHRARAAQQYLERLGVPREKIQVATFGSERPKVEGHDESAWAKNRRGELAVK